MNYIKSLFTISSMFALLSLQVGCSAKHDAKTRPPNNAELTDSEINFELIQTQIFNRKSCLNCHSGENPKAGLDLNNKIQVRQYVDIQDPPSSQLLIIVQTGEMPPAPREPLTSNELEILLRWIELGAP